MQAALSNINIQFQSPSNKAVLVDALTAAKVITHDTQKHIIIKAVEEGVATTVRSTQPSESLVDMNKRALVDIRSRLLQPPTREPYTAQDIADARTTSFDTDLHKRQEEFDSFMKRDTPQGMDFSDTLDKPIGSEMDSLLAEAASRRELDMNPHNIKLTPPSSSAHNNDHSDTAIIAKMNSLETKVNTIEELLRKLIVTIDKHYA